MICNYMVDGIRCGRTATKIYARPHRDDYLCDVHSMIEYHPKDVRAENFKKICLECGKVHSMNGGVCLSCAYLEGQS